MSKPCRVCSHPEVGRVDRALAAGQSPNQLARAFLNLNRKQIAQHRRRCLIRSPKLVAAIRAGAMTYDDLSEMLKARGREDHDEIARGVRAHLESGS